MKMLLTPVINVNIKQKLKDTYKIQTHIKSVPENVTYPCGQCALYSLPNHILTLIAGVSNIVMNRCNVSL